MSIPDRRAMLERHHPRLSIRGQCLLLGIARSGVHRPVPAEGTEDSCADAAGRPAVTWPFLGSGRMTEMLRAEGINVNRKRVRRLMKIMGMAALGPKPSRPPRGHKIYPCVLRDPGDRSAEPVWAADITCIPIGRGCLYLVAIIDWFSRAVLAWRLHNTMGPVLCRIGGARSLGPAVTEVPPTGSLQITDRSTVAKKGCFANG